jgi:transposase
MNIPRFVRKLERDERAILEGGLHSRDAFVLRRSQIVLASADGQRVPAIALRVGRTARAVHAVLDAFEARGVDACLKRESSRPRTIHPAFDPAAAECLRAQLHQSPRDFGKPTSLWTLDLAAEVSFERGLTPVRVTGETVRATLARLGVRWRRAKHWITSPDPGYLRKKGHATG